MQIVGLLLLAGLFGFLLLIFRALGWVIVTGFHVAAVILLAMVVEASIVYWRKRLSKKR